MDNTGFCSIIWKITDSIRIRIVHLFEENHWIGLNIHIPSVAWIWCAADPIDLILYENLYGNIFDMNFMVSWPCFGFVFCMNCYLLLNLSDDRIHFECDIIEKKNRFNTKNNLIFDFSPTCYTLLHASCHSWYLQTRFFALFVFLVYNSNSYSDKISFVRNEKCVTSRLC